MLFWSSETLPLAHRKRGDSGIKNAKIVVNMHNAKPKNEMYAVSFEKNQKMRMYAIYVIENPIAWIASTCV